VKYTLISLGVAAVAVLALFFLVPPPIAGCWAGVDVYYFFGGCGCGYHFIRFSNGIATHYPDHPEDQVAIRYPYRRLADNVWRWDCHDIHSVSESPRQVALDTNTVIKLEPGWFSMTFKKDTNVFTFCRCFRFLRTRSIAKQQKSYGTQEDFVLRVNSRLRRKSTEKDVQQSPGGDVLKAAPQE